ncbi:MAG: efflux RND transporter periplasmic adaptor subunit [Verrucomicrobia bacterium]|nr:efflux RND transporter periplasmic adaptor subunit [Verrucomicrobiota bacterium]MCH8510210.1 efflux RND transporter periplasmic adaptor subunit [Kiritimatiellia bacterium]
MKTKSKLILFILVLGAIFLIVLGLRTAPVPVSVATAERGPFAESIEEEGRTVLRHPHILYAPVTGYLRRVEAEEGDAVQPDQTLFVVERPATPALDPLTRAQAREEVSAGEAALRAAESALAARAAERAFAEREVERNQPLLQSEVISPSDLDRLISLRDQARETENAARHQADSVRHQLQRARAALETAAGSREPDGDTLPVVSPVRGVVLALHRRDEGPVSAGTPVLAVGSLDTLEVRVDLLSMDAVRVEEGMDVVLTRWGGEGALRGKVRRVEPAGFERISALGVEEQRVPVWVALTTPLKARARLGTDYRVEAGFILWEEDEVLQIPTSAVFRRNGASAVYIVEDDRAVVREIRTGRRDGMHIQVLEGLQEGERVISHPSDRVGDGVRVQF